MKAIATSVLGAVCIVAFCGFCALHAMLTYATNPAAIAATAREASMYDGMLDVVSSALARELERGVESAFERYALGQTRPAIRGAVTEDWFYQTVETTYGGLLAVVTERQDPPVIDLSAVRSRLREGLLTTGKAIRGNCAKLTESPVCKDKWALNELLDVYRKSAIRVTSRIPTEIAFAKLAGGASKEWLNPNSAVMAQIRAEHRRLDLVRWGALAVLILALVLIGWMHHAPFAHLFGVLGLVTALAAGVYLAVVHVADEIPALILQDDRVRAQFGINVWADDPAAAQAVASAEGAVAHVLGAALHNADTIAWGVLVLGLGLLALGWVLPSGLGRRAQTGQLA